MNQNYQNRNTSSQPKTQPQAQSPAPNKWKEREMGAMWAGTTKTGEDSFSIKLNLTRFGGPETVSLDVYKNNFKEKENQPDWRVYVREEQANSPSPAPKFQPKAANPQLRKQFSRVPAPQEEDAEIL